MLHIFLFGVVAAASATEYYKLPAWECDGGVKYTDAPIIFYYNASDTLCYADRKGCTPSEVKETFETLDKCISTKMPSGRTKSKGFMCEMQYFNRPIYTFKWGKDKAPAFPILRKCHLTERFCPEGYACYTASMGVSSCCALSDKAEGQGGYFSVKYNKNYA